jgi:threonine dehydrogenase-like Zn-dependent dehydrogenase
MTASQSVLDKKETNPDGNSTVSTVAIVGGGKVGLQLLSQFCGSSLARVVYVVDKDPSALAVKAAQHENIATFTDYNLAIAEKRVDFIFEVTGSAKVAKMLQESLAGQTTQLITHDMAFILLKVMEENRDKTTAMVRAEISGIEKGIANSLEAMTSTILDIKHTMSGLSLLAINARIEAAHAGVFGRGFDIVAQQVDTSAGLVRNMIDKIEEVNANIQAISEHIEESLRKLA